jgi:hypothetical protein
MSRGQCGGNPTAFNLSFLDWSHYFFFQVPPHLFSRAQVDPVPDPLLLQKSGSAVIEPGISGFAARESGHKTTEAVFSTHASMS